MRRHLLASVLMVLLLCMIVPWAHASNPIGFVAAVRGEASVVRDAEAQPAWVGTQVMPGDRLKTGSKARLKVLLSDDTILALGADTEVVITTHLFDPQSKSRSTRLNLAAGALRALVQGLVAGNQADFMVHTSNAVAGVRGTEFALVASGQSTRLYAFSGEVDLTSRDGKPVVVEAGKGSRVEQDQEAASPSVVATAELSAMREATDTEQSPIALAWNLPVTSEDLLVPTRTGVGLAREGGAETGTPASGTEPEFGAAPDGQPEQTVMEPCKDCARKEAVVDGSFQAGGVSTLTEGKIGGDWFSGTDVDRGSMMSLTLNIHLHRQGRPVSF